jgi:hypothetical protein
MARFWWHTVPRVATNALFHKGLRAIRIPL